MCMQFTIAQDPGLGSMEEQQSLLPVVVNNPAISIGSGRE